MTAEIESYIKGYLRLNPDSTTKDIYLAVAAHLGEKPSYSVVIEAISGSEDIVLTGHQEYKTKRGNTAKASVWSLKDLESKLRK